MKYLICPVPFIKNTKVFTSDEWLGLAAASLFVRQQRDQLALCFPQVEKLKNRIFNKQRYKRTKDKNKARDGPGVYNFLSHIPVPTASLVNSVILRLPLGSRNSSEVECTDGVLGSSEHGWAKALAHSWKMLAGSTLFLNDVVCISFFFKQTLSEEEY